MSWSLSYRCCGAIAMMCLNFYYFVDSSKTSDDDRHFLSSEPGGVDFITDPPRAASSTDFLMLANLHQALRFCLKYSSLSILTASHRGLALGFLKRGLLRRTICQTACLPPRSHIAYVSLKSTNPIAVFPLHAVCLACIRVVLRLLMESVWTRPS